MAITNKQFERDLFNMALFGLTMEYLTNPFIKVENPKEFIEACEKLKDTNILFIEGDNNG